MTPKKSAKNTYKRDGSMCMRLFNISPVSHIPNVKKEIISINDTDHVSTFPYGSGEASIVMMPHVIKKGISLSFTNRINVDFALS
jgi:hypothetical protein